MWLCAYRRYFEGMVWVTGSNLLQGVERIEGRIRHDVPYLSMQRSMRQDVLVPKVRVEWEYGHESGNPYYGDDFLSWRLHLF